MTRTHTHTLDQRQTLIYTNMYTVNNINYEIVIDDDRYVQGSFLKCFRNTFMSGNTSTSVGLLIKWNTNLYHNLRIYMFDAC